MKNSILSLVIASFALGSLPSAQAGVETYDIDPVHTWVGFTGSHFFTKVPGYFGKVKGTIIADRDHLDKSTMETVILDVVINVESNLRKPVPAKP